MMDFFRRFKPDISQTKSLESPRVSVYTEFQPLEEVIVGRAHPPDAFKYHSDPELRDMLAQILFETEEDLQALVKILEDMGVKVVRPTTSFQLNRGEEPYRFDTQNFNFIFPNHPLMPRDTLFAYGNTIAETYTRSQGRYFENWSHYDLHTEYFKSGANWIAMPPPPLGPPTLEYKDYNGRQMLYHAANLLRCGRDIFYSQPSTADGSWSGKGTELGLEWFKRQFPEARFHPAPCQGHLDGKMALLKPGVLTTWAKKFVPEKLSNWVCIEIDSPAPFPESFLTMKKRRFYKEFVTEWLSEWIGYVDETVFDVNMFSVSENCVITNGYNEEVYKQFRKNGIEGIPWKFRHQYFWDGAIHCVTLDVRRRGGMESYL